MRVKTLAIVCLVDVEGHTDFQELLEKLRAAGVYEIQVETARPDVGTHALTPPHRRLGLVAVAGESECLARNPKSRRRSSARSLVGAKVRGFSAKAARDSLRGVKIKKLPRRTGHLPPGVGGAAKLRHRPR